MSSITAIAPALETLALITLVGASQLTRCAWRTALVLAATALLAALTLTAQGRWQAAPLAGVALAFLPVLGWFRRHPEASAGRRWRIVLLSLTLLAAVPIWLFPIPRLPKPDGPFAVGTATADWAHPFPEGNRRLKVRLWYPAVADSAAPVGSYLAPEEAEGTVANIAQFASLPAWALSYLSLAQTHGRVNAAPADGGPFPLVLFSHGYWFYAAQNTALAERLASHGYIVASVAHPGDSAPVAFSDGSIVETIPYGEEAESPGERRFYEGATHAERLAAYPVFQAETRNRRIIASLRRWREDVIGVLDDLHSGNAAGVAGRLSSSIDFARVAFVGMSFGGTVSASTCAIEPRCLAAVNLDGFEFDAAMFDRDIGRPLLMLLSDRATYPEWNRAIDRDLALNDYFYERHAAVAPAEHVYRVRVRRLKHLGFTDLPLALRRPLRTSFVGALERDQAIGSVNVAVQGFLDRYVRGDAGAFSETMVEGVPALDLHRRGRIETRTGGP